MRSARKYKASITHNKKRIYLGLFDDEEEAANAYNEAAILYFKEFAVLNDITSRGLKND